MDLCGWILGKLAAIDNIKRFFLFFQHLFFFQTMDIQAILSNEKDTVILCKSSEYEAVKKELTAYFESSVQTENTKREFQDLKERNVLKEISKIEFYNIFNKARNTLDNLITK